MAPGGNGTGWTKVNYNTFKPKVVVIPTSHEDLRDTITDDLNKELQGNAEGLKSIVDFFIDIMDQAAKDRATVVKTADRSRTLGDQVHDLERQVDLLETEVQTLRYDLAVVNDATKNCNIKIDGKNLTMKIW